MRWETGKVCTFGLSRYGSARGCVSKENALVLRVPVGVLLLIAAVRGMALTATPFALGMLVEG